MKLKEFELKVNNLEKEYKRYGRKNYFVCTYLQMSHRGYNIYACIIKHLPQKDRDCESRNLAGAEHKPETSSIVEPEIKHHVIQ